MIIYTTAEPAETLEHDELIDAIGHIQENPDTEFYVAKVEMNGDKVVWAWDMTKTACECLASSWLGLPLAEMLHTDPHIMACEVINPIEERREAREEVADMRSRPQYGGM
jgi:hypothetical protein